MSSLDSVLTRQALAKGVVRRVTNDAPIGLRLRYVGSGTVTSVTVVSATSIAMITSDGGTDTYAFGSLTTMGAVVDAINRDGIFEAKIVDTLRSQASANTLLAAAPITAGVDDAGGVVWDAVVDTSGAATLSCVLSPTSPSWDLPKGHRVHLRSIVYYVDNTAAQGALQIWKRKGTVETQIAGFLNVDTTETTVNFASGHGKITADADEELVVHIAGTVINNAANAIMLIGDYE
jgi:hypothetical protein